MKLFARNQSGATLAYVAVLLAVMLGMIGLAFDFSRAFLLNTELQKAADAAATAGAYQLDPGKADGGKAQAETAIAGAAITANSNKLGTDPGAVTIASSRFLQTVPANDDDFIDGTHDGPPYRYVMVTTTTEAHQNIFTRIMGAADTTNQTATSVARKGQALCSLARIGICSPNPGVWNPSDHIGEQVVVKASGGGSWAPGNWGLLVAPDGKGTPDLAEQIGGINGVDICIDQQDGVDTKPGAVEALRTAFNVRFDMYEPPHMAGKRNDPNYPPAENVGKGKSPDNPACNSFSNTDRDTRMPRDSNIDPDTDQRFGNGDWNCSLYWDTAHPAGTVGAGAPPTGCTASSPSVTRYETYLHEITNSIIPDTTGASPVGDNANPQCYTNTIPETPTALADRIHDRRIMTVAVMDCTGITGSAVGVPVDYFVSMFLTEPSGEPPNTDVFMEIVGTSTPGGGGVVPVTLQEWVEVVR